MSDRYVTVTHNGCLSNIFGSFIGALFGVVLFFGSFVGLWWNEGLTNMATVAKQSTAVDAAGVNASADGKLVAISGTLTSPETLGDGALLRPGQYVALERKAEMYAWTEKSSSDTNKELGGGSTTTTTYTYSKEWTSSPSDSQSFKSQNGHYNPPMKIKSDTFKVSQGSVGVYRLDMGAVELPTGSAVALNEDNLNLQNDQTLDEGYVYMGTGTASSPQVGDLRVSYLGVPNNITVTAFGRAQGSQLVTYTHPTGDTLYRVFDRNREAAIKQMGDEYTAFLWIMRILGFIAMWVGLGLVFNPISAFANVVPFIGTMTGWVIGALTFAVALALTLLTIIIATIVHSIWLLLVVVALLVGGGVMLGRARRGSAPTPAIG